MAEFMRISRNEWVKLFRRRRFLVVLLIGIVLVAVYAYAEHYRANDLKRMADPVVQKQMMEDRISRLQTRLDTDTSLTQAQKTGIQDRIQSMNQSIQQLSQPQSDPTVFDERQAKQSIDTLQKKIDALTPDKESEKGQLQIQLQLAQYALDHRIPLYQDSKITTWGAIGDFLNAGSQLFFPLLCVLLAADMVSGEQTGGTIKLLLTRPASRGKILFTKYITSITGSIVVVAFLMVVMTGLLLLLFGTDGANQPVAVDVNYDAVSEMVNGSMKNTVAADPSHLAIIPALTFSIDSMLLTLLAAVAMCTLGFFCSVLVRSAAVSTGLAMAVIIIGSIVGHVVSGAKWLGWFITPHFGLPLAWTGDLSRQFGFPTSLGMSVIVLLVWTAGMYAVGHVLFRNRDILA